MPVAARELTISLPENVAAELEHIAEHSHLTMADIVQTAFALVKIAADASKNKQKLVVADQSGKPLNEIVFPK